ncbi:glycosyltransferase family 39 protein [Streptomyces sp. F63]|uniref:ArnT family glycosyltransferase n=1 Tax=Streptomyces sp. F63 TaxID=2824887 RepID=UPI001B3992DD|nr:glycosyltransferase family 39 protein [Streptomyces sp. F63]MBQ0986577.1 glycosyltransferase family 39 protein [Streptomyces sp. F63]
MPAESFRSVPAGAPSRRGAPAPLPAQPAGAGAAPRPSGRRRYWVRLVPLLAALVLLARLPSFLRPLWNPDEGYLAVQARMLAAGGSLYETVVDRKPPLMPWLYQGAFALFGDDSLWPLRVLAVLAQVLTAVLLASLARRRWGDAAGRTAGVLYALVSIGLNPEDTQAASFGVFMLPATAAAVWSADRARWGTAGLMVAVAALTKQTGAAVLLPVLWLLWRHGVPAERPRALLRLAGAAAAPVVAAALLTDPRGFLFWTVTGSAGYASPDGSVLHVLARAAGNAGLLAAACAGLLVPLAAVLRRRADRAGAVTGDLWVWTASSVLAVATGFHFFGHYYLQLIPPLVLLGTAALRRLPRPWTRGAVLVSAASCLVFAGWGLLAPGGEPDHARRLAERVERRTDPADRVLFWGMHPEQYWFAGRMPATRYLTAGLLTNYSGGREDGRQVGPRHGVPGSWPVFRRELAANPPEVIVDDSRGKPYRPARVPDLRELLRERYEPVERVDGAVLYVLREDAPGGAGTPGGAGG